MTFRNASTAASTTGIAPAGYQPGDILLAMLSDDEAPTTFTFPSGWIQVRTDHITNGDTQSASWGWTVATGTDSFAFTFSDGGDSPTVSIWAGSALSGTPIDVTPSGNNPNSASPPSSPIAATGLSISPPDAGCDIVLLAAWDSNNGGGNTYAASGSMVVRTSGGSGFSPVAIASFTQVASGATGNQIVTRTQAGDAGNFIAYLVALAPSGGGFTNTASIAWVS